jgi:hypothetical protein
MTDSGKRVLAYLLMESGYFDTDLSTLEELAVLNFVKKIIKNIGIVTPAQTTEFVQKLFEISVVKEI